MRSNAELLLKIRRSTCEKEIPIEAALSRDSKHRCASLVGRGLSGSTRRAPATKLVIDCDIGYGWRGFRRSPSPKREIALARGGLRKKLLECQNSIQIPI